MPAPPARRARGSGSALPLPLSLALAWVLLEPARSQQCPSGNPLVHQFLEIGADQRVPAQHRVPCSLDPLYSIVRRYLDVIQQNPFPTVGVLIGAVLAAGVDRQTTFSADWKIKGKLLLALTTCGNRSPGYQLRTGTEQQARNPPVVHYQVGYVVCAVIAALFFVAVPVTGLCFCCCRRRRRCGGHIKAYRRSLACWRNLLTVRLFLTTAIVRARVSPLSPGPPRTCPCGPSSLPRPCQPSAGAEGLAPARAMTVDSVSLGHCAQVTWSGLVPRRAGVICAFVANHWVKEQMEPGARAVPATFRTLRQHVSSIPQGVQSVVEQFAVPRQQMISDLDSISRSLGLSVHSLLKEQVHSALEAVQGRAQDLQNSRHHMESLNKTVGTLTHYQGELGLALRGRKESALSLLDDPRCTSCARALDKAQQLELGADYRRVPSVEKVLKTLHSLPKANFPDLIRQGNSTFNSIPGHTVGKMARLVQELKDEVNQASGKLQSLADSFPVARHTQPLTDALMQAEQRSRPYLQEVTRYERYRWIVGILLCSVVLLVVVCNLLGLSLGMWGLARREDPSDYECRGAAGAKLLLVGVGFSFLFSGLLVLLVFATFLVGGNVQTLLCKNWANREIYKFIDTPGNLPPSMNITQQLGLKRNLNLSSAYQRCKKSAGLWEVLQLTDPYSLEDHLHVSQYARDFQKRLENFNVQFDEIYLLDGAGRQDLETFRQSGLDQLDYPAFRAEMQNPVVRTSLDDLAKDLEGLQKIQNNSTMAARLASEAQALRKIQNTTVLTQDALVAKLNESVHFLSAMAPHLQLLLKQTMAEITLVETLLPAKAQRHLRQEIGCFTRKQLGHFSQYLNWVRRTLTEDVASCQPLATALDNGRVILCDRIAEPWNAFWFSLGCCTFFLIPSIIFAIKLTKHFLPIRNRLVSTASEETYPFHIPRVTALKL
nr:prominin-2 [Pelodiscus sinensis]|eukprot:XP_025043554.1 prominin-2 [Pelodiscus sinensis]